MRRGALVMTVAMLVVLATGVWAVVTITYPVEGQTVGSSTPVRGMVSQKAFLVIYSDIYRCNTNEHVRRVPGIRHWTKDDGSFAVRIATPRVFADPSIKLIYKIHVRAYSQPNRGADPPDLSEAVVTVKSE